MAGGYYRPAGRKYWIVWFPWKGGKISVRQYFDGSRLWHEEQAKRVLGKIRAEIDQGVFEPSSWGQDKALLIENAWETYQLLSKVSLARYQGREHVFETYIKPTFAGVSIRDIRTIDVAGWLAKISQLDFSPSYLHLIKGVFHAFLFFHSDSLKKMPKFPPVSVPRKSKPWLTPADQDLVFEFIPTHHHGIMQFCRLYGCRSSEACKLKKSDLDWQARTITFRERKAGDENILPITQEAEEILRAPKTIHNLGFVFCGATGNPYGRRYLWELWAKANRKAHDRYGVKIVPWKNATRHSLASQLASRGEPLAVIARILGNSEKVAEANYRTVDVENVARIMERK